MNIFFDYDKTLTWDADLFVAGFILLVLGLMAMFAIYERICDGYLVTIDEQAEEIGRLRTTADFFSGAFDHRLDQILEHEDQLMLPLEIEEPQYDVDTRHLHLVFGGPEEDDDLFDSSMRTYATPAWAESGFKGFYANR